MTDWRFKAACAGLGVGPDKGGSSSMAKKLCMSCECLEYALTEGIRWGVWGGVSAHQRRRLEQQRKAAV
jgi:WhiB family redox-sensing transcriptional regulator